jgi:hypothetical protein
VEHHSGGLLISRVNVELEQVEDAEGERVWFPMRGTFEMFSLNGVISTTPLIVTTISVEPASLRINQGLPDSVFQIDSRGGVPETSGLKSLREAFRKATPPRLR